jgi:hypothetical protein
MGCKVCGGKPHPLYGNGELCENCWSDGCTSLVTARKHTKYRYDDPKTKKLREQNKESQTKLLDI